MSDDGMSIDREGIHIEADLAAEIAIEEELDANIEGEYTFPDPIRRRISGWVYLVGGVIAGLIVGWPVGAGFGLLALWHFMSSWHLNIDEHEALAKAARAVGFPVGHASASIRFVGWRSRPQWAVVLYSATEPPDHRALVVVDAVSGDAVDEPYVEALSAPSAV